MTMDEYDYAVPDRWVYLVVVPTGGTVHGTADRDRAYELAHNTGQLVTKAPVYTDRMEEAL
jgi:hypothetical protein